MPKVSIGLPESERAYLNRIKKFPDQIVSAHEDSVLQGFQFFESEEFVSKHSRTKSLLLDKLFSVGIRNLPKMIKIFAKYMSSMMRGINQSFIDLEGYLEELEKEGRILQTGHSLLKSYPNEELWKELTTYAWEKWQVTVGFTELPNKLIFKGKAVLFNYALVCIQEMEKEKVDLAPSLAAGEEVQRIYNTLGLAVNDIANWLRQKHGVKCQSNHPLGGLVDLTPLAAKAGLGWQGCNGLLITPQYGQRQRIATLFIQEKIFPFTDNQDHVWIESFCKTCRRCEKACPVQAIYPEKKPGIQNVPGIQQTRTCIDRLKCFPQFNKTLGCSICLKVCPFSKGNGSYEKIKSVIDNK